MERRTFVQTGVAGALGLSLRPAGLSLLAPDHNNVHAWLRQFSDSLQSKRIRGTRVLSDSDLRMMESIDQDFAQQHFHREDAQVYLASNNEFSYLYYPVFLRRKSAGLCDLLVSVFTKKEGDNWRKMATFSGFQIEALARAASLLEGQDARALLLPVGGFAAEGAVHSYRTEKGSVAISTVLKGSSTTSIQVHKEGKLVVEETFSSQHRLTSDIIRRDH